MLATTGHFKSAPPSDFLSSFRPFPQVSGTVENLNHCIRRLEHTADNLGISIDMIQSSSTIGDYQPAAQQIRLHQDFSKNRALYAFTLAHELAHALDPQYTVDPGAYDDNKRVSKKCEIVADAVAVRVLGSYGMRLEPPDGFLKRQSRTWRKKLQKMAVRYRSASLPLMNPDVSDEKQAQRTREYNNALKWGYKVALSERKNRAGKLARQ